MLLLVQNNIDSRQTIYIEFMNSLLHFFNLVLIFNSDYAIRSQITCHGMCTIVTWLDYYSVMLELHVLLLFCL